MHKTWICCLMLGCTACPSLESLLQQQGFTVLQPPSALMTPGTVVYVVKSNPLQAGIICLPADSLGAAFSPQASAVPDETVNDTSSTDFSLSAGYKTIIDGSVAAKFVNHITVSLSSGEVLSLSDTDVLSNLRYRSSACREAILARQQEGYAVTMINQALRTDVTYNIEYSRDVTLSVESKQAMLKSLAPALGIDQATVTDSTIAGKDLVWGVMDDAALIASPEASETAGAAPVRAMPAVTMGALNTKPDVSPGQN